MFKKYLFMSVMALFAVTFAVRPAQAFALPKVNMCHNGVTIEVAIAAVPAQLALGATLGACVVVTPSPSPSASPSATPSTTPTPSPTPDPCDLQVSISRLVLIDELPIAVPCITPIPSLTPTPEPSETPGPGTSSVYQPSSGGGECNDKSPVNAPANFHMLRNGIFAQVKWEPGVNPEGNKAQIFWGVNGYGMQHSLVTENDGFVPITLYDHQDYTFWGQILNGCAAGPMSASVVDGNTTNWVLFR